MIKQNQNVLKFRKALDKHLNNEINREQLSFHKQILNDNRILNFAKE